MSGREGAGLRRARWRGGRARARARARACTRLGEDALILILDVIHLGDLGLEFLEQLQIPLVYLLLSDRRARRAVLAEERVVLEIIGQLLVTRAFTGVVRASHRGGALGLALRVRRRGVVGIDRKPPVRFAKPRA